MTHTELIEREAENFFRILFLSKSAPSIEHFNTEISGRLYSISKEQDQMVFLIKLKNLVTKRRDDHRKGCKNPNNCLEEEENGFAIVVIDQLLEEVADDYEYEPNNREDRFSSDDITLLNNKIDQILEILKEHDLHHEVIFNEVDDLRYHFNLGKRNWWSLLKGKIIDWAGAGVSGLAIKTVLEETGVADNISDAVKALI